MDFNGSSGDTSFEQVETLLESDLENFDNELDSLYSDMEYFAEVADAMETAGRDNDAEYFRETLAVDRYDTFVQTIQMKKLPEEDDEYNF